MVAPPPVNMPPVPVAPDLLGVDGMLRSFRALGARLITSDPGQRDEIEYQLRTLESWKGDLIRRDSALASARKNRKRYTALQIVCVLRANFMIRGPLEAAMEELAPLFGVSRGEFQRKYHVPKMDSIKKYALAFDAASCLSRRSSIVLRGPCARWFMCDSSPQCGHDWLWMSYSEVGEDRLVDVLKAAWHVEKHLVHLDIVEHMQRNSSASESGIMRKAVNEILTLRPSAVYEQSFATLSNHIHSHVCVPVGLAGGFSGVSNKASAMLHAFALDLPADVSLESFLNSFVSSTSDMGTEMSIADFEVDRPSNLLPGWSSRVHGCAANIDVDLAEEAQEAPPPPPRQRRQSYWHRQGGAGGGPRGGGRRRGGWSSSWAAQVEVGEGRG